MSSHHARTAEDALRLSEARFEGILSIASDAVVSTDEAQRITFFNRGAEEIFGFTAQEVLGQPLDVLIPEQFRAGHIQHVREFGESPVVARRMGERGGVGIFGRRKSGEVFPAEASISKLDIGGTRIYTAVLRDISERRLAEREIETLLERERDARATAEAASLARDEVLRILAHDLGNSLGAVMVSTKVLLRTLPPDIGLGIHDRVANIRDLTQQMQHLRQDLLDVARIEAGRLSIEPEAYDVEEMLREALRQFAPLAEEKRLELTGEFLNPLPAVLADRQRILQVLANVLGNAIKFTLDGGRVTVRAERSGRGVRISITDTGPGIPAEHLPHLFDRFWQAKHAVRAGAGLGLAIAKGIMEAHGGEIVVDSPEQAGATFYFTLPSA